MGDVRLQHLVRFYALLDRLERSIGGARNLSDCSGRTDWPQRGVYFFREPGESRTHTGTGPRIVRVGTHALKAGSGTRLWTRLSQHKGQPGTGGGNHRGSIFRLLVGTAIINRQGHSFPTWDVGNTAKAEVRAAELALEREVSAVIGAMPFLWIAITDDAGPQSLRGYIERNTIALLSNHRKDALDPASQGWLGAQCDRELVRSSGLWNQKHVEESHDPAFLSTLEELIDATQATA